jgi:hypothetical protein
MGSGLARRHDADAPILRQFCRPLLNIIMSNSATFTAPAWPDNIGPWNTSWQRVGVLCNSLDTDLVFEAICDLNPHNATPDYHVAASFYFRREADMVEFRLRNPNVDGLRWNIKKRTAHLDPCDDPDAAEQWIEAQWPRVSLTMTTIFRIDMRDGETYRQFLAACEERLSQFQGTAPKVEFVVR